VDVAALYDVENYRPKVQHVLSKPVFLYQDDRGVVDSGEAR
jgi:hypothetical protein